MHKNGSKTINMLEEMKKEINEKTEMELLKVEEKGYGLRVSPNWNRVNNNTK